MAGAKASVGARNQLQRATQPLQSPQVLGLIALGFPKNEEISCVRGAMTTAKMSSASISQCRRGFSTSDRLFAWGSFSFFALAGALFSCAEAPPAKFAVGLFGLKELPRRPVPCAREEGVLSGSDSTARRKSEGAEESAGPGKPVHYLGRRARKRAQDGV